MDTGSLSQSPFTVLTFIAAPAVLTNAASVLALSTINRMLRTRDRMQQLFDELIRQQQEAVREKLTGNKPSG